MRWHEVPAGVRSLTREFKRLVGLKRQMATVQLHGDYVQLLHAVSQISSCASQYNGHGRLAIDLDEPRYALQANVLEV